jgi:hypothetical protein
MHPTIKIIKDVSNFMLHILLLPCLLVGVIVITIAYVIWTIGGKLEGLYADYDNKKFGKGGQR